MHILHGTTHVAKNLPQELLWLIGCISRGSPNTSQILPMEGRRNAKCPKGIPPTSLRGTSLWECRWNSKGRSNKYEKYPKLLKYFR